MKYLIRLVMVTLCLLLSSILLRANDPAQEFSISTNPHGVWSYGFTPTLGGPFTLADKKWINLMGTDEYQQGADWWFSTAQAVCDNGLGGGIGRVEQEQLHGSQMCFRDTVTEHPGCHGELATLRWTAPLRGTYEFRGNFQGTQIACGGTSTDVHIRWNSAISLFDGEIYGFVDNRELLFNVQQQVTAGDTIDFAVGFGLNGNYYCDATSLQLILDLITAIDIKPGDPGNTIPIGTPGTVAVAILSDASFDAPAMVSRRDLTFGRMGDEPSLIYVADPSATSLQMPACSVLDVNGDGRKDLVCQFDRQKAGFQLTDTVGTVGGKAMTGITIRGTDSVYIVQ